MKIYKKSLIHSAYFEEYILNKNLRGAKELEEDDAKCTESNLLNQMNQSVQKIVGDTYNKVTDGAHKALDKVTGILNWGKGSDKSPASN